MKVKTISTKEVWKAPDGKKTIWEVTLKADDGQEYGLKTFSEKVAAEGFEGEVESYVNNRGDRFVKQVAKQNPYGGKGNYSPKDQESIRAQWAIGQAVTMNIAPGMTFNGDFFKNVQEHAKRLYSMVEEVRGSKPDDLTKKDTVHDPDNLPPDINFDNFSYD